LYFGAAFSRFEFRVTGVGLLQQGVRIPTTFWRRELKTFGEWPKHTEFRFPEPGPSTQGVWFKVAHNQAMNKRGDTINVNANEGVIPKNLGR